MGSKPKEAEGDVWNVVNFQTSEKAWSEKNFQEKMIFCGILLVKFILMVLLLYLFIISLDLMANSFRILGGKTAGRTFRNSDLFDNPLAGLVIGILVTVLVQSSSTSTSIIITMTAGNLIEVKNAIPMIMGANIGTSVTNTIVSLGSIREKDEYRRAFAGATVHDCFNYLTVLLLLPLEAITGVLRRIAAAICDGFDVTDTEDKGSKTDFLKKLTKPVASRLLGIDKKLITAIAKEEDEDKLKKYDEQSIIKHKQKDSQHLFLDTPMTDGIAGVLMVCVSLAFLCMCLMMLVKLLQTIFRGRIAIWFRSALNLEIQAAPFLANYILIFFGMCITILFQSSSVTTSTLTPLVGIGLVKIDKMFAFTIGANVGTTITGILSALVSDKRKTGLTVAFSHTLFNLVGFLIWYPAPLMRNVPIEASKVLGTVAADFKWFPVAYIFFMFGLFPLTLLGLSLASPWLALFVGVPLIFLVLFIFVVLGMRQNKANRLPNALKKNPDWMRNYPSLVYPEDDAEPSASGTGAVGDGSALKAQDADLGKGEWKAAPAAWGSAWFVVLCLLVVVFNCQWAMAKYTSWDGREHFGIGAWKVCSNAFVKEKQWAPTPNVDPNSCSELTLSSCGSEAMQNCKDDAFSRTDGAHLAYQESWSKCRSACSAVRWGAWCQSLQCGGGMHVEQCSNVTKAVQGMYDVTYDSVGVAWSAGDRCRKVDDLCKDMGSSVQVPGNLALVGWLFSVIGLIGILAFQFTHSEARNMTRLLYVSLGAFFLAWVLLLASWAQFGGLVAKDATCIVDSETNTGAVWAHGRFGDIFSAGAYAYGYVIGAWVLLHFTVLLVVLRVKSEDSVAEPEQSTEEVKSSAV